MDERMKGIEERLYKMEDYLEEDPDDLMLVKEHCQATRYLLSKIKELEGKIMDFNTEIHTKPPGERNCCIGCSLPRGSKERGGWVKFE